VIFDINRFAQHRRNDGEEQRCRGGFAGVVFLLFSSKHHPFAVMRGGDYRLIPICSKLYRPPGQQKDRIISN